LHHARTTVAEALALADGADIIFVGGLITVVVDPITSGVVVVARMNLVVLGLTVVVIDPTVAIVVGITGVPLPIDVGIGLFFVGGENAVVTGIGHPIAVDITLGTQQLSSLSSSPIVSIGPIGPIVSIGSIGPIVSIGSIGPRHTLLAICSIGSIGSIGSINAIRSGHTLLAIVSVGSIDTIGAHGSPQGLSAVGNVDHAVFVQVFHLRNRAGAKDSPQTIRIGEHPVTVLVFEGIVATDAVCAVDAIGAHGPDRTLRAITHQFGAPEKEAAND
jgi:hypothetical protein